MRTWHISIHDNIRNVGDVILVKIEERVTLDDIKSVIRSTLEALGP